MSQIHRSFGGACYFKGVNHVPALIQSHSHDHTYRQRRTLCILDPPQLCILEVFVWLLMCIWDASWPLTSKSFISSHSTVNHMTALPHIAHIRPRLWFHVGGTQQWQFVLEETGCRRITVIGVKWKSEEIFIPASCQQMCCICPLLISYKSGPVH